MVRTDVKNYGRICVFMKTLVTKIFDQVGCHVKQDLQCFEINVLTITLQSYFNH